MTVRRLTARDVDAFRAIRLEALSAAPEAFASRFDEWQALDDAGWAARLASVIAVAAFDADETPVGLMAVRQNDRERTRHRGDLVMVYLRSANRGGGLADAMLDAVKAAARDAGVLQLELQAAAGSAAAIRFYERRGFARIGTIPRAMRERDGFVDDTLMVCALDA